MSATYARASKRVAATRNAVTAKSRLLVTYAEAVGLFRGQQM